MTGTQYKNVAQWTLANGAAEASDSAAAAKAIFDNMGVPFPAGSCGEILLTLMSEDYMGWRACTHLEAQEYANAGTAAVGIDGEHVVVILPEEGEGLVGAAVQANATSYARQASDISTAERITMQFYANMNQQTIDSARAYYGNLVAIRGVAVKDRVRSDFLSGGSCYDADIAFSSYWCVDFVRWCFKKTGVYQSDIIKATSSSGTLRNWYRDTVKTLHNGVQGIRRGDVIFTADHLKKNGSSYVKATDPAHTCIAISAAYKDSSGKWVVDAINGNWSGKVKQDTFGEDKPALKKDDEGNLIPLKVNGEEVPGSYMTVNHYVGWYAKPPYELAL